MPDVPFHAGRGSKDKLLMKTERLWRSDEMLAEEGQAVYLNGTSSAVEMGKWMVDEFNVDPDEDSDSG